MKTAPALIALMLGTACAAAPAPGPTAGGSQSAHSRGFSDSVLAEGEVDGLPPGPLYMNVIDIGQPPAGNISHRHVGGFVYAVSGNHRMTLEGGPALDLAPGHAGFVGSNVAHSHINADAAANDWWFISIRPSALRASALVPGQRVLYATDDVPPGDIPSPGALVETLRSESLEPQGRSAAHRHRGPVLVFVRTGSLRVKTAGQPAVSVEAGAGIYVPAGTVEQESNTASTVAGYLVYTVTRAGEAPGEEVPQAP